MCDYSEYHRSGVDREYFQWSQRGSECQGSSTRYKDSSLSRGEGAFSATVGVSSATRGCADRCAINERAFRMDNALHSCLKVVNGREKWCSTSRRSCRGSSSSGKASNGGYDMGALPYPTFLSNASVLHGGY